MEDLIVVTIKRRKTVGNFANHRNFQIVLIVEKKVKKISKRAQIIKITLRTDQKSKKPHKKKQKKKNRAKYKLF